MELAINRPIRNQIVKTVYTAEKRELFALLKAEERFTEARELADEVKGEIEFRYTMADNKLEFSVAQREAYTTVGGSPEIENEYTVFGEIIKGMEVIDKIASLKTDTNNRPLTDVVIRVRMVQ